MVMPVVGTDALTITIGVGSCRRTRRSLPCPPASVNALWGGTTAAHPRVQCEPDLGPLHRVTGLIEHLEGKRRELLSTDATGSLQRNVGRFGSDELDRASICDGQVGRVYCISQISYRAARQRRGRCRPFPSKCPPPMRSA